MVGSAGDGSGTRAADRDGPERDRGNVATLPRDVEQVCAELARGALVRVGAGSYRLVFGSTRWVVKIDRTYRDSVASFMAGPARRWWPRCAPPDDGGLTDDPLVIRRFFGRSGVKLLYAEEVLTPLIGTQPAGRFRERLGRLLVVDSVRRFWPAAADPRWTAT